MYKFKAGNSDFGAKYGEKTRFVPFGPPLKEFGPHLKEENNELGVRKIFCELGLKKKGPRKFLEGSSGPPLKKFVDPPLAPPVQGGDKFHYIA